MSTTSEWFSRIWQKRWQFISPLYLIFLIGLAYYVAIAGVTVFERRSKDGAPQGADVGKMPSNSKKSSLEERPLKKANQTIGVYDGIQFYSIDRPCCLNP